MDQKEIKRQLGHELIKAERTKITPTAPKTKPEKLHPVEKFQSEMWRKI